MNRKHLHLYVAEFVERQNIQPLDNIGQIESIVGDTENKRLRHPD